MDRIDKSMKQLYEQKRKQYQNNNSNNTCSNDSFDGLDNEGYDDSSFFFVRTQVFLRRVHIK